MIVTASNGRRRSVRTNVEDIRAFTDGYALCTPEERALIQALLNEGDPNSAAALSVELNESLYRRPLVSIQQFIEDPYYLGDSMSTMYPELKKDLVDLFSAPHREAVLCLHPDTPVPLLNGTMPTMRSLSEKWAQDRQDFWIYGVDEDGHVRPALATEPRCTGEDDYYRVTLDDGSSFVANARHRMVMRGGGKRQVMDMAAGDSLMPFETVLSTKGKGRRIAGYEMVMDLVDETMRYTHAMVAEHVHGPVDSANMTIHHVDFDKRNNDPENLSLMPWADHQILHTRTRREWLAVDSEKRLALSERQRRICKDPHSPLRQAHAEFMSSPEGKALSIRNLAKAIITTDDRRERGGRASAYRWNGPDGDAHRAAAAERMRVRNLAGNAAAAAHLSFSNSSPEAQERRRQKALLNSMKQRRDDVNPSTIREAIESGSVTFKAVAKKLGCSPNRVRCAIVEAGLSLREFFPRTRNHYVVSVEPCGRGPVYCMTVPDTENFAIATKRPDGSVVRTGVFSSNTGSIGAGKTYLASAAICRILYELSCLKNPQLTFGLSPGTEMVIMLISKNLVLAREVMKTSVDDKIKLSPYFMQHFTPRFSTDYTLFPHNIRMNIGSYGAERALGANIFSSFLDETNFPPKRSAQQINQTFGKQLTAANFDVVEKVYRSMVRRIKSRFQTAGGDFPGMVIMVSSAATLDSFTERKLREAKLDPTVFVRDHTAWTSKPKDHFCGKWFYVLCSKSSLRSRILEDGECDEISPEYLEENNAWMIEVPVEYREDFESNLEDSLRDIAGVSTQAISAFFQRVDAIDACIAKDRKHPFSSEVWISGSPATFDWDYLCRKIERRLPGGFVETAWAPKEEPSSPRWIHIDTSISGDSTGFVMGRISRWVEVVRRDGEGHAYTDTASYYVIEAMLCIRPPSGDQIYMPDLRRLVYELQAHGFPIHGFSSDSFQYVEMHQQIRRHGIHTELISMDRTIDPFEELKSAIYEKRIEFYEYTPLLQELRSLEYDRVKGKIDHPRHSSKDVSDALAGVVWGLRQQAARLPWAADADTPRVAVGHDHGWVSDMIPAEDVDLDEVRAARSAQSAHVLMPFFIGDD